MSVATVQEWARANSARYHKANKAEKRRIVDEFASTCERSRRYLQQLLRHAPAPRSGPIRRPRARRYGDDVRRALEQAWEASDRVCARRLVPFLPELVPRLERSGHLSLQPLTRQKLLMLSVATADRLLSPRRRREGLQLRSRTRPGTLLKHQIPVRTFADWDDARPGFLEVDLVAHCGDHGGGEFIHTLTLTDVRTQWTEFVALPCRSQQATVQAIDVVRKRLPFPVLGIDSDNGSEFINTHLKGYCERNGITFTRSRANKKNDQCRVEQKNGQIVRRHVGYARHESREELDALERLYRALRHWQNYFQPSMRLVHRERNGARVTRRYDKAQTPCQRLLASGTLTDDDREQLVEYYQRLDPVALRQATSDAQTRLTSASKVRNTREATTRT